jgi:hypothetical protein
VIHMTTALFLVLIGSHLEYSNRADLYVFLVTLTIAILKLISCFDIMRKSEAMPEDSDESFLIFKWLWLSQYKYIPYEVFFAIQDSIKYIQFIYIAKWVKRRHLVTMFGFWFFFVGFVDVINVMLKHNQDIKYLGSIMEL